MDADHISGIEELFAMGYPVRRVLLPAAAEESAQDGEEQGVAEELEAFASQGEKAAVPAFSIAQSRRDGAKHILLSLQKIK